MPLSYTIDAKNLTFGFKNRIVLNDLSFRIEQNEFVSFIGPSGCGKTTLLNCIAGIYKTDPKNLKNTFPSMSMVFQSDSLLAWRNVIDNILLPIDFGEIENELKNYYRNKAKELLKMVGLQDFEYYYPSELSGGMKKRVEIARALITEPALLILDEPFSSLDIITRERLNKLIKSIWKSTKTTIILVTHSVEEACFLSNRVYVMSNAPATIVTINEIEDDKSAESALYVLSENAKSIETDIRRKVNNIWDFGQDQDVVSEYTSTPSLFFKKYIYIILIPIELFILAFLFTGIKNVFNLSDYMYPYPIAILQKFIATIKNGFIFQHLWITLYESLIGFIIAFILTTILGYIFAKSKLLYQLFFPYLIAFNTIPSIALVPFLVLWFGFGLLPKIVIAVIIIFFPMLISTITAIKSINKSMQQFLIFFNPPRMKRLFLIEIPGSLPIIFNGIKVSITFSVIGAVVGEFDSGTKGLGSILIQAKANFDPTLMYTSLIWLIILGLSYFGLASLWYYLVSDRKKRPRKQK